MFHKRKDTGFTIVELLIVIVVIGILAALVLNSFSQAQKKARDSKRKSDITALVKGLETYYAEKGEYPNSAGGSTSSGLNGAWSSTADSSWDFLVNQLKPYMGEVPRDPLSPPGNKAGNYSYFSNTSGSYCGSGKYQTYIITYQLETESQKNTLIGECPPTSLGPYSGYSNYRKTPN